MVTILLSFLMFADLNSDPDSSTNEFIDSSPEDKGLNAVNEANRAGNQQRKQEERSEYLKAFADARTDLEKQKKQNEAQKVAEERARREADALRRKREQERRERLWWSQKRYYDALKKTRSGENDLIAKRDNEISKRWLQTITNSRGFTLRVKTHKKTNRIVVPFRGIVYNRLLGSSSMFKRRGSVPKTTPAPHELDHNVTIGPVPQDEWPDMMRRQPCPCNGLPGCPCEFPNVTWVPTEWSKCGAFCGEGLKTRQLSCR
jgi:hypothetical protein